MSRALGSATVKSASTGRKAGGSRGTSARSFLCDDTSNRRSTRTTCSSRHAPRRKLTLWVFLMRLMRKHRLDC